MLATLIVAMSATACSSDNSRPQLHPATTPPPSTPSTPASAAAQQQHLRARVVGRLPRPVSRAVAVLSGSRIVVLGGLTTGDVTTGRVVAIDPSSWTAVDDGALQQPVHDASGASLRGHALVFGGGSSTEVAAVQSWTDGAAAMTGRLPSPRSDSSSVTIRGTAYVVGGFDGVRMSRAVVATRDGQHFRTVARLKQGVRYAAVAAYVGSIYVLGGQLATSEGTSGTAQSRLMQRIDLQTGRTQVVGKLPWGLGHAMAFSLGGRLYLAGGRRGTNAVSRIWQVDPRTARLTRAGWLPRPISDSAVVPVGQSVALIGGETTGPFAPQRWIVAIRF